MSSTDTLWIGRVSVPGHTKQRCVRVRTDGRAPSPNDIVDEIEDPFVLACPGAGGPRPADAYAIATTLPHRTGGLRGPVGELQLQAPLRPGKILCVGRNYAAHAKEMGNEVPTEPVLFFKPASALIASDTPIHLPRGYDRIDMEAELVVVIGLAGRHIRKDDALMHIAGYTLGNDVSCRDLQQRDKQWTRAKGFDGFAPLGPWIRLHPPGSPLPGDVRVQGLVDETLRQDAPISHMLFPIPTIIAYISACMTLEPGDIIYTGTPEGVSPLVPGGRTTVRTAGFELGHLTNALR